MEDNYYTPSELHPAIRLLTQHPDDPRNPRTAWEIDVCAYTAPAGLKGLDASYTFIEAYEFTPSEVR